ncbi:MAG: aspartate aminotransferase family protein [Azospirillaceae bacterium]|nr:aspartate aminotransferase family protein [Azospirillaceae bacterium]
MVIRPNSIEARDVAAMMHPFTDAVAHEAEGPFVLSHGDGIHVVDTEGRRYIEALSGLFCASLGFSEHRLADAAYEQMKRLPFYHTFGGKSHPAAIELAERLLALSPVPMAKVLFSNSGSEANDTAMKLVWYFNNAIGRPEKKKIISRIRAYHGVTIAASSLTGLPNNHLSFDLPIDRVYHTDCPHHWRFGLADETEEAFASRCARSLEDLILREGPNTVAAFFAEPLLASGGCIVPPPTYYEKIQAVLRKYDVLLIADEVICGFGRLGTMFGSEHFGMRPDMITMAKQLSAAYQPISALMMTEEIYRAIRDQTGVIGTFGHGFTYSGHPVAASVALETLKIYEERNILGHVRDIIPAFQARLARLGQHTLVGEARGCGLIGAVEIVRDKATKENFDLAAGVAADIGKRLMGHGVLTRAFGHVLTLCPPLIITEAQLHDLFDRIEVSINETHDHVRALGLAP